MRFLKSKKRTRTCHAVIWWTETIVRSQEELGPKQETRAIRQVHVERLAVSLITIVKARGRAIPGG